MDKHSPQERALMYRLDYLTVDGKENLEPVKDFTGRDFLCQHMATARNVAGERAELFTRPVLITRIGKSGALKASLVAHPDGSFTRPPDSAPVNEREDCKAGTDVTCFCSPCRAQRRLI